MKKQSSKGPAGKAAVKGKDARALVKRAVKRRKKGKPVAAVKGTVKGVVKNVAPLAADLGEALGVGVFHTGDPCYVYPEGKKARGLVFIRKDKAKGALEGHKVIYSVMAGGRRGETWGEVSAIVGHISDPGVDVLSIIAVHGMRCEFPAEVVLEAEGVPKIVLTKEYANRRDYREQAAITIDGADAKDLDDAVYLESSGDGCKLYVHIADVGHYVRPGSALDKEAFKRGTSAYLADRVIPMLPRELSNGICSLNAGEDRLALSCIMEVNKKGWVTGSEICESVIRVRHRMTYDAVDVMLTEKRSVHEQYAGIAPMIYNMGKLAKVLKQNRLKRGSLELYSSECKFEFDGNGFPTRIIKYLPNEATSLIEEFMILCNETVARAFSGKGLPFIYRTHEAPDPVKTEALAALVKRLGLRPPKPEKGVYPPKSIQRLLFDAAGTPMESVVNRVTLMSMNQARYTAANTKHFGLASSCYCHFTSPIRRYPDLWIHKVIKASINGNEESIKRGKLSRRLEETCRLLSAAERLATETERDVESYQKIRHMSNKVGELFDGVISGVKNWGLYVELDNTAEGLIPMRAMTDDYYDVDEQSMTARGRRTAKTYGMGDAVRVRVVSAIPDLRRLDLELV